MPPQPNPVPAESSLALLTRAQAGDHAALDLLIERYRPRLRRWAHHRLPHWARDLADTDDLVQETLLSTVRNLRGFTPEHAAGFQNYIRTAIANAVRDHVRRAKRRKMSVDLDSEIPSDDRSPLEHAVGRQRIARYEVALARLDADEREAVVARLEFGFTHLELAAALGKATPDAARKLCRKAIDKLLSHMQQPQ